MSATNRGTKRNENDFYETPGWVTRAIVPHLRSMGLLDPDKKILEPAAGRGAIINELVSHGVFVGNVHSYEIDEGRAEASGSCCDDFLSIAELPVKFDLIITNPPYSLALEFAQHSLTFLRPGGVLALLTRLNWLASQKRATWLRSHTPSVFVLPKRPSFTGTGTDATDYAWMLWRAPWGDSLVRATPIVRILEVEQS